MSFVIGRNRYARAVYPTRSPASVAGAAPFAQLGLSGDVHFTAGVGLVIPFNTLVYQSAPFGEFETISGVSVFAVPFGAYLAVLQAETDTTPTKFEGVLEIASNTAGDVGGVQSSGNRVSVAMSAVRLSGETPVPGNQPCIIQPAATITGGGNGNILATVTRLFVWQLARF